jgi:hypothetical protein
MGLESMKILETWQFGLSFNIIKFYKNSQNAIKIKKSLNYLKKKCLIIRFGGKMHYLQAIT